jgi:hypothetical protein
MINHETGGLIPVVATDTIQKYKQINGIQPIRRREWNQLLVCYEY